MGESKPEPKPDKKRVTLRDVAEEAGVSLKTASNVINHSGRMTDSTREKVQEVIDRLGYRVNASARNLNRGKTGFITLAVPTLTAPYLSELANRVIDAARGYGQPPYSPPRHGPAATATPYTSPPTPKDPHKERNHSCATSTPPSRTA